MSKERKAGKAQKVKSFFGYKVNEIEYAIIQSRLAEYIKEAAETIVKDMDENFEVFRCDATYGAKAQNDCDAHGEMIYSFADAKDSLERVFLNFEKWLAHETWRRPVKRK